MHMYMYTQKSENHTQYNASTFEIVCPFISYIREPMRLKWAEMGNYIYLKYRNISFKNPRESD